MLTAQEDDRAGASDPEVLERATESNRVLFTQDDDLLVEANRRQKEGTNFSGGCLRAPVEGDDRLVSDLVLVAKVAEAGELEGGVLYLPL